MHPQPDPKLYLAISKGLLRTVQKLVILALILYVLYLLQILLIYIAIAIVISLLGYPVVSTLEARLRLNNTLAVLLTIILFLCIILGVFALCIPLINQQGKNLALLDLSNLEKNIILVLQNLSLYFGSFYPEWLQSMLSETERTEGKSNLTDTVSSFLQKIDLAAIPRFFSGFLGALSQFIIAIFSIAFISFFLLKDAKMLERVFFIVVGKAQEDHWLNSLEKIKLLLSRYFLGLLLQIAILFVIYSSLLFIFGIPNAIALAFLCALLNLIPYLGPVISGLLMLLATMTSDLNADFSTIVLSKTLYVMLGFFAAQMIDNFFSQPYIFSNSVRSHPLEIFIIILTVGMLFGILGLIAAVPVYTTLKVVLKEFFAEHRIVKSLTREI